MDREVHAKILSAAEAEGASISAWLTAAARQALPVREGLEAVAEWEAEHGTLTESELDAAKRLLRGGHRRRKQARPKRSAS